MSDLAILRKLDADTSPGHVAECVVALAIQAHVPVYVWSAPGTGKSSAIRALTESFHARLWTIMLSVREPADQGGLPAVYEQDGEQLVRMVPPGWARELIRHGGGTVFLDEITAATPATMNSALRIVQEGVAGDSEKLPSTTSFVLAGNPGTTNVGANALTAGMANRCLHVAWPFDYARWRDGMLRRWAPVDRDYPQLLSGWEQLIPDMAALIVAFLDARPTLAQQQPDDLDAQGGAWPSGRSWDLAATMLAAAKSAGYAPPSIVAQTIVLGLVGEAVHKEWSSWVANMDLPSIESVMADPTGFPWPKRLDQVQAVLSGVVGYVAQRRGNYRVYFKAWSVACRALDTEPSIAIRACRDLTALMPEGADTDKSKDALPFVRGLKKAADHLKGAGADYGRA